MHVHAAPACLEKAAKGNFEIGLAPMPSFGDKIFMVYRADMHKMRAAVRLKQALIDQMDARVREDEARRGCFRIRLKEIVMASG